MTTVPTYFTDFLAEIRVKGELERACQDKHRELNRLMHRDPDLSRIMVDAFLQGSYRRNTGVRPLDIHSHSEHVDVDLVVVTTLDPDAYSPDRVVEMLTPFLERHFAGHWSRNDRSVKITYDDTPVTLDLVVTAARSLIVREYLMKAAERGRDATGEVRDLPDIFSMREALSSLRKAAGFGDWRADVLLIPDRELRYWVETHPIRQIEWTVDKNGRTGGHYVNVVKAIKWWRRRNDKPEYPKGYPLEHLVGAVCPDQIESVAEGITLSLEAIARDFQAWSKPQLPDHGVPDHDVFRRVTDEDFAAFLAIAGTAAVLARNALNSPTAPESAMGWRALLGPEFPVPDGGFTKRVAASTIATTGRYGSGRLA